jgi:hypothetical protein
VSAPPRNHEATTYEIRVRGTVSQGVAEDIGALRCEASDGKTVVVVDVLDQSHLQGIFDRLGDLNIEIESVNPA